MFTEIRCSECSQQNRPVVGNYDSMLKMSRKSAVRGSHGPTVGIFNSSGRALGNQRFDGDHKTIGQRLRIEGIAGVRNDGVFMDNPTYPVPGKLTHNPESLPLNLLLDCMADAIYRFVCSSYRHRLFQRLTGTLAQSGSFGGAWRNRDRDCCVCDVALQFGGDIQAYNVTGLEHPLPRNTVNDLVIDADKVYARKTVNHLRCGPCPVPVEHQLTSAIDLRSGCSRPNGTLHFLQRGGYHLSCPRKAFEILRRFYRQRTIPSFSAFFLTPTGKGPDLRTSSIRATRSLALKSKQAA